MKIALCISGILGGASGRNGVGGTIHPSVGFDFWNHAIIDKWDTDVFIHSWSTEAKNSITNLYKPKKCIIEPQKQFSPKLSDYGKLEIDSMLKDRRYSAVVSEYDHGPGDPNHPSKVNGDSNNLWDHLRYQSWCQHSKWYASQQAVRLKQQYEKENNFTYDFVVLGRFDLYFNSVFPFDQMSQDKFYASPRNWGAGYRDDHDIALMDLWFAAPSLMMDEFVDLYDHIYDYCITGPHSSRERVVECFGEDKLEYLFLDGIDYGALRHRYSINELKRFVTDDK